jgi:hypothetical protein
MEMLKHQKQRHSNLTAEGQAAFIGEDSLANAVRKKKENGVSNSGKCVGQCGKICALTHNDGLGRTAFRPQKRE